MSFWPFSNPYGTSSHLQKFLDQTSDLSTVTAESLLEEKDLSQELLDELKTISAKSLRGNNLSFVQSLQQEAQNKQSLTSNTSDNSSVTSSNTDSNSGGSLSKTAREQKLLELLLQPHILHGLIDFIVQSVDFFHEIGRQTQQNGDDGSADDQSDGAATLDGTEDDKKEARIGEENAESRAEKLQRCISCSAEILSTDLWVISNRVIETPSLMGKLWSVLSLPRLQESSPSLAYIIQILGHLMDSNCIELTNFIRKQDMLVDTFLNKVDIPILMDFFLKIIQTDKPDSPTGILEVLSSQKMIPKLLDILRPPSNDQSSSSAEFLFRQTSATELLKALVTISSNPTLAVDLDTNIGPNQLTRELASPKSISVMLDEIMLHQTQTPEGPIANKSGISNCVSILIELIRKNNSDYDSNYGPYSPNSQSQDGAAEINVNSMYLWLKDLDQNPPGPRDPIHLGDLLRLFSEGLPALVELMNAEPTYAPCGKKTLGLTKFKIAELVAELLHCSNMLLLNSAKIAFLIGVRDRIRELQQENILTAITESITEDPDPKQSKSTFVSRMTDAFDTISLEQPKINEEASPNIEAFLAVPKSSDVDRTHRNSVHNHPCEDTDDDEPSVSNENPFVSDERDKAFRESPSAGDYFKIRLVDSHMLESITRQFTVYPWHNFFHNVVFDLVQQVFNGKLNSYNSFLIVDLFDKCSITSMIARAFKIEEAPRPGYMGHLVLISEEVVKFSSLYKPSLISPVIVSALESDEWEWYVSDVLLKTREMYNVVLGTDPNYSHDDKGELRDEDVYGYDSSTVGYMDIDENSNYGSRHAIILGDSSNHDEFVSSSHEEHGAESDGYVDDDDDDDEDGDGDDNDSDDGDLDEDVEDIGVDMNRNRRRILDVPIKSMSPNAEFENKDMLYEDFGGHKITFESDKYLDDFPGSSSSDEETENQLYRVSKHQG